MYYVDTSAAAKLVLRERGSAALRRWMGAHDAAICSSDVLRVELQRAVRLHAPELAEQARSILGSMLLTALPTEVFERAARIGPPRLRSLDALHLAAAMELGDDLDGILTYDDRLAAAAHANGIATISPR